MLFQGASVSCFVLLSASCVQGSSADAGMGDAPFIIDAGPEFVLSVTIDDDNGAVILTVDGETVSSMTTSTGRVFLFEREYASYGTAIAAPALDLAVISGDTELDRLELTPGQCERCLECIEGTLTREEIILRIDASGGLHDVAEAGGCVRCTATGSDFAICP